MCSAKNGDINKKHRYAAVRQGQRHQGINNRRATLPKINVMENTVIPCCCGGVLHLSVCVCLCAQPKACSRPLDMGPGHSPESSGNLTDRATQAGDACSSPLLGIVSPSLFGQAGMPT